MTRVLISADMEGTTGITSWDEVMPGRPQYERGRRLLTGDLNAAIRGAFDGGADEVWVNEAHHMMRNVLIEELDPRAQLISGAEKPRVMMEGVDQADLVFFAGYHAAAGERGVLAHTYWRALARITVNGQVGSEALINAAVAGEVGVPVTFASGDDLACAAICELMPWIKPAVVKHAIDNLSARCYTPQASAEIIETAACEAVRQSSAKPFLLEDEIELWVELREASQAGVIAAGLPGAERLDAKTVQMTVATASEAAGVLDVMGALATAAV